jgi:hypothetical protein
LGRPLPKLLGLDGSDLTVTNTLAYHDIELTGTIKHFIVKALACFIAKMKISSEQLLRTNTLAYSIEESLT